VGHCTRITEEREKKKGRKDMIREKKKVKGQQVTFLTTPEISKVARKDGKELFFVCVGEKNGEVKLIK